MHCSPDATKWDPRLEKAAWLIADAPDTLKTTILMVMREKGFSDDEAKDYTLQQRVHCQAKELQNKSATSSFTSWNHSALASSIPTSINADPSQVSKLSDLDVTPPPSTSQANCKTSLQAQHHHANQL